MRRTILILAIVGLLFRVSDVRAQTFTLKGCVLSEEALAPIAGLVISVQSSTEETIVAYGTTDEDGKFSLSIPEGKDNLRLTVSSMMTETVSVPIVAGNDEIRITVKEKRLILRESKVHAPKVDIQGDTINYNVSSYLKEDDRNIGEVLKRLPGVTVTAEGEIFYQNLQVNKFYVEGMDLLQGRYGLATNNIDPDMVSTIQVLENHQPIRVLKGMEIPQQAAINIKLQKSAIGAFFLTAQLGVGVSPLLYSNELLGMRFTQRRQDLLMYKNDNTGRDITSEMTSFYGTSSTPLLKLFSLEKLSSPSIGKQHYLYNDAHLFSLNDLSVLKKGFTLTSNLHFMMDRNRKNGSYRQTIYDSNNGDLLITEEVSSVLLNRELSSTITLEKNEKDCYLNNRTDVNIAWNQQDCNVVSDNSMSQTAELPSFSIENKFTYNTAKGRWTSHIQYSLQNNALKVTPVLLEDLRNIDDTAIQQVRYGQSGADLRYYRNIRLSKYSSLELNLRPFLKQKNFVSGFSLGEEDSPILVDSLRNNIARTELGADVSGGIRYKKRSLNAFFNVSAQYLFISKDNKILTQNDGRHLCLLAPGGYLEYKRRSVTYRINASYIQRVSDIRNDLTGYMMSSYRSFSRADGVLPRIGQFNTDVGLHYKSVQSSFFSSFMVGYVMAHKNTIQSLTYDGVLCQASEIDFRNKYDNCWMNVEMGTDIRPLASTLKINAKISRTKSMTLVHERAVDYVIDALQGSLAWYSLIGSYASISYEADYSFGGSLIDNRRTKMIHDLRQSAELSFSFLRNASVKVSCNHYYNSGIQTDSSRLFAKIGVGYKHKKTEWLLDWSNILNTKDMIMYYYDDISSFYSQYKLRPMELLLRVKISIL